MNGRPVVHHNTYCHHEAGHAVAFWHYGIEIIYVKAESSNPLHSGETKTVDHDVSSLLQIENEMQCVAAGKIAERLLRSFPEELTNDELIDCFTRFQGEAARDPNPDPNLSASDGIKFAKLGRVRDIEILKIAPDAVIGPRGWLSVFRKTQQLIEDELAVAVRAVAYELARNPADLHNEDVAALAVAALN